MTDIPPQRYRIVERKGRIIVTDTWAEGGRPSTPLSPAPGADRRPLSSFTLVKLRSKLVDLACLGAHDDAGRPILTTANHFDEKGPRGIPLSDAGAVRLGNVMLAMLAATVGLLVLLKLATILAFVLLGGVGLALTSANTTARPAITRWLDLLGDVAGR